MVQKMESRLFHFDHVVLVLLLFKLSQLQLSVELELDSIFQGQRLAGENTLISKGGIFAMGFFAPPGSSHNYYIGIWYNQGRLPMPERTVVWVANRDHPVTDPHTSRLELGEDGILILRNSLGLPVWSTGSTDSPAPPNSSTVGTLGQDGNFVISEILSPFRKIWQSFDHPTDTLLPGAKFGYDEDTGINTVLTSWKDTNNPASGLFSAKVEKIHPKSSQVQLELENGFDESKFCSYKYDFCLEEGCECGGSMIYSHSYIMLKYGQDYSYHPKVCLFRYVLGVNGQLKLFVWPALDFNEAWRLVTKKGQQTCNPSKSYNSATWITIKASALLATLLIGIIVLLRIAWGKDKASFFEATGGDTLKQYKHRDLCWATKNFTHKIGNGGFSTVYKGELPNSTFIAVKELQGLLQEEKQLRAELNTIGLIQHKNLVRLHGFCSQDSKRFLVYDYMPNGSLESHLFQRASNSNILDWGRRYNIALGTAKALAYLHEECRDCIIHCDIKPENILLDADYSPKVADFGLAKLLCRNFSRVLTTMRGTRGYLAPEWFSGEPITAKVDVYSYGQVLFEIISGRRNMDLLNNELSSYFPALVLNALNNGEEVLSLVDSKLEGEFNVEELSRACKVACWCIQDLENDRPTMTQVVQILEGLLDLGIPPIPRFFQSIAETSMKESDIKGSEAYSTSSSQPSSFAFQPSCQTIQHVP